jgi:hypothetical protein
MTTPARNASSFAAAVSGLPAILAIAAVHAQPHDRVGDELRARPGAPGLLTLSTGDAMSRVW